MISQSLKRVAQKSTHPQFFHAAQIKMGSTILATDHNSGEFRPDSHAEVRACKKASKKGRSLRGATVISIRVTNTGKLANAKPCAGCVGTMIGFGIRKVIYSTAGGALETMKL